MDRARKRSYRRLTQDQKTRLVEMRDGAHRTWREIGREFGLQDGYCKAIYDEVKGAVEPGMTARPLAP